MLAAICNSFRIPLEIEDVVLAPPGAGEVHVRVRACAICHSDLSFIDGLWGGTLPAVYGHEASGEVLSVGPGVTDFATGDRVVVTLVRACGECPCCSKGMTVACEGRFHRDSPILSRRDGTPITQGMQTGAFAEQVVVDQSQLVRFPAGLGFDVAALLACGVITGVGAVTNTAQVRPGESVAIIGLGGVGMNAVQGARLAGADPIIGIDISPEKLETARKYGATETFLAGSDGIAEQVRAATSGRGVDYAFVCAGAKAAMDGAPDLLAPCGAMVVVGMPASGIMVEYEPASLAGWGQRILGSKMGNTTIRADIPYLIEKYRAGDLELDGLIGQRFPLDRINDAIAASRSGTALRNVIVFD